MLRGTPGPDVLRGRGGDDALRGGAGRDRLIGGRGRDRLVGGPGADLLLAGAGADRIEARDGRADGVVCGAGADLVVADRSDRVASDCEVVGLPPAGAGAPPASPGTGDGAAALPRPGAPGPGLATPGGPAPAGPAEPPPPATARAGHFDDDGSTLVCAAVTGPVGAAVRARFSYGTTTRDETASVAADGTALLGVEIADGPGGGFAGTVTVRVQVDLPGGTMTLVRSHAVAGPAAGAPECADL